MRIKLAILDTDTRYLNRIVTTFNTKFTDRLEVYSFTDQEVAIETIKSKRIDVLVASDDFEIDVMEIESLCGFAYFVESQDVVMLRKQQTICKYQKVELIYKQILSIYSEKTSNTTGVRIDNSDSNVVVFASASGGVGSSTMSAAFCIWAARCGKKVLYLNLETFGDPSEFFNGEGQADFGDIIYAIKSKKTNIGLKIESTVRESKDKVHFFAPTKTILDVNELKNNEILQLVNEIRTLGTYEYIVIDIDFSLDERTMMFWRECDALVMVSDGSEISNLKLGRAYQAFQIFEQQNNTIRLDKMKLIYNKFSNKTSRKLTGIEIFELGGVPKYDHATTEQIIEQIIVLDVFSKYF